MKVTTCTIRYLDPNPKSLLAIKDIELEDAWLWAYTSAWRKHHPRLARIEDKEQDEEEMDRGPDFAYRAGFEPSRLLIGVWSQRHFCGIALGTPYAQGSHTHTSTEHNTPMHDRLTFL